MFDVSSIVATLCKDVPDLCTFEPTEVQLSDLVVPTAKAGCGLVEYFQHKTYGTYINASRLFLYKATRTLMHKTSDSEGYLRETLKALVLSGVPPEDYWLYTDQDPNSNAEPPAFYFAFGQRYRTVK
ncbi:MAG: hypothetical protein ACXVIK_09240 [Halobacteriota archaeon]